MIATNRLISTPTVELAASRSGSLRRWNIGLGLVHAVQAVAALALATAFALPVTATPWLAVGFYLWSPGSTAEPPAFVYAIFVSLFLFFNIFALNMWLQYRRVGRWKSYIFGERAYFMLSLVAKSALAWQVFAGTLAG